VVAFVIYNSYAVIESNDISHNDSSIDRDSPLLVVPIADTHVGALLGKLSARDRSEDQTEDYSSIV